MTKTYYDYSQGKQYGSLTCTGQSIRNGKGKHIRTYYLCQCNCGNTREVLGYPLVKGLVTACTICTKKRKKECIAIRLEPGERYGRLIVQREVESYTWKNTKRTQWLCRCDCGREETKTGSRLIHKQVTQCSKCSYKARPQSQQRCTSIERLYNLSIVGRCKKSGIKNNLPLEDYTRLIAQSCYYCESLPKEKSYATQRDGTTKKVIANGVDRLDSKGAYNTSNCVPCCKRCNIAKNTMSKSEFLAHIKKIYNKWSQT